VCYTTASRGISSLTLTYTTRQLYNIHVSSATPFAVLYNVIISVTMQERRHYIPDFACLCCHFSDKNSLFCYDRYERSLNATIAAVNAIRILAESIP